MIHMRCVIYLNVCGVGFEKWSGGPEVSEIVRNYLKKWWCRTRNIYLLRKPNFTPVCFITLVVMIATYP